jgi:LysR family glycine cleavage system transcriptional activator
VADDLATGRLVAPFPGVTLPTRGYHAYLPDSRAGDLSAIAFCRWLEDIGEMDAVKGDQK